MTGTTASVKAVAAACLLAVAACARTASSSPEETIVATGLQFGRLVLVVGESYHVREGMTDKADAGALIAAREGSASGSSAKIEQLSAKPTYRHYGNDGEAPSPLCRVADQGPVEVDSDPETAGSNFGSTMRPVACVLPNGSTLYVTGWLP